MNAIATGQIISRGEGPAGNAGAVAPRRGVVDEGIDITNPAAHVAATSQGIARYLEIPVVPATAHQSAEISATHLIATHGGLPQECPLSNLVTPARRVA